MLSKKMLSELNKQINEELFSAYLYQAMSAHWAHEGFAGFAHWLDVQAKEETEHARKFYEYILARGDRVELASIEGPQKNWKDLLTTFKAALAHEEHITRRINSLADLAIKEKDHATLNMLQWFIAEQVEEEEQTSVIAQKLTKIKDHIGGLFQLDKELGKRGSD